MLVINIILQRPGETVAVPADLSYLNSLGLIIFLIGVIFLILLLVHYYKMRDNIQRKHGPKRAGVSGGSGLEATSQYQYMSREEMREMILKERAERDAIQNAEIEKVEVTEDKTVQQSNTEIPINAGSGSSGDDHTQPAQVEDVQDPIPPQVDKKRSPKTPPEAEILAGLILPSEEESDDEKEKESPEHPYMDKIQRSVLSNELPEEFRGKSRKI